MSEAMTRLSVDKQVPGYWRVTINHPPINTADDLMYDEIFDLVQAIDVEPDLKVVTFESANPDYFLAHYGIGESESRFGVPRWRDAAIQLAHSKVLSVAVIRGRARGHSARSAMARPRSSSNGLATLSPRSRPLARRAAAWGEARVAMKATPVALRASGSGRQL